MSAVAHEGTLKPTPDSMTEGPNYHSHGSVNVCVIDRERDREREHRVEEQSERQRHRVREHLCMYVIQT